MNARYGHGPALPSSPQLRGEAAGQVDDARPYLTCLTALFNVLSTNDVYDPATDKWESRRPMAVPRNHAFAAAVNGKIYVIGGRTGHGFIQPATNTDVVVEEYDPANDMWSAPQGADADTPKRRRLGHRRPQNLRGRRRGYATKQLVGVSSHRGVRADDQFLDHAALHADAASWRSGRGDRQSLSPGERHDHVCRGQWAMLDPELKVHTASARRFGAAKR